MVLEIKGVLGLSYGGLEVMGKIFYLILISFVADFNFSAFLSFNLCLRACLFLRILLDLPWRSLDVTIIFFYIIFFLFDFLDFL